MPRANFQPSSARMQPGDMTSGSLRPSMLNTGFGASTRSPSVNVGIVGSRYTPVKAPQKYDGNPAKGAVNLADVLVAETARYVERQTKLEANGLVNSVARKLFDSTYGTVDEQGKRIPGYLDSKGKEALGFYGKHIQDIRIQIDEALGSVDSAVAQKAAVRLNNIANEYINKAAKHRAEQFNKEEDNDKIDAIERIKQEGIADADSIFLPDPETGLSKVDAIVGRYADTAKESLALKEAVLINTFEGIANREGSKIQSYTKAKNWYDNHKTNMTADSITHVRSRLKVLKSASDSEAKNNAKQAEKARVNGFYRGGSEVLTGIMRGGENSHGNLRGYIANARNIYKDDPEKADNVILGQMKAALSTLAKESGLPMEAAHSFAIEQFMSMQRTASNTGIDMFYDQSKDIELDSYATSGLMKELMSEQKARDDFYFAVEEKQVRSDLYKAQEGIDKGVVFFSTPSQVRETYDWAVPMATDTPEQARMRETATKELIDRSKKKYAIGLTPNAEAVSDRLFEYANQDMMFKSNTEFEYFMTKNDVITPASRNRLLKLRKELRTPEGSALKNYGKEVLSHIRLAFRGSQGAVISEKDGTLTFEGIFNDNSGLTPEESNLRLEVKNVLNDPSRPPIERVNEIKAIIDRVKQETGKDDLASALQVKAEGVHTSKFVTINQIDQVNNPSLDEQMPTAYQELGAAFMERLSN